MGSTKPVTAPMTTSCKLSKHGDDVYDNPIFYRSIVGALKYATITRLDITYSVNKKAVSSAPLTISAFCDTDWASDMDDRKSTSGVCIFLGPNLITWWSKK
ncbi:PREDICTED: uncharacterized protein LOC109343661 [Lupinus angustifolius]|uniref:uncharacterized protein LOC109343586 n=1 Tax=Lupinus angustifolius TaxID=3871 RepID=UPI00092F805E|nr:PREDICTED: uncharacterized protein LOC109343586 [Lupinus angustifolius]XP_019437655.1 PREDICTED: uncharacterized protein LOC109343661 [Lupinus angustifolius]